MRLHSIQHAPFETPGIILDWAAENGHTLSKTFTYSLDKNEAAFPALESFDWLVIMGGAMNVYEDERYPWLTEEKAFIKKAAEAGKTVLGLCLGAQLLAAALGGEVTKNAEKEIGWFPVTLTREALSLPYFALLPEKPLVFQWHGDTFSTLPPGAVLLAEGDVCKNQAFMYGERVFAFQFHWENTRETIQEFIKSGGEELAAGGTYIQKPDEMLAPEYIKQSNAWMRAFLSRLDAAAPTRLAQGNLLFAVASKDGKLVDQHFGHATVFAIYEYAAGEVRFQENRQAPQYCAPGNPGENEGEAGKIAEILKVIGDCAGVISLRIGEPPRMALAKHGIKSFMTYNRVEEAVREAAESLLQN
ncbi:MAG: gamma-glutamyl-gamma-aminobutyrate hydrolase family protein [Spirochaetales bacterium]|jgi:GMP synthase-like glutamine amidotransferase/predicted Fe-Mo cluster-binding NifX family protein|nr:gamma-glutamyl-gamma-aminobutyrate hydrolase family protein [Spirochaetales bacterium]